MKRHILLLLIALTFSSCGSSSQAGDAPLSPTELPSSSSEEVEVSEEETAPVASSNEDYMICEPGSCSTGLNIDGVYLDFVKKNLPPLYVGQLSDSQLMTMASIWCSAIHENETSKMEKLFSEAVAPNDYKLYYFSLIGAAGYCLSYSSKIEEFLSKMPEPQP